jgi:hypothetical protein
MQILKTLLLAVIAVQYLPDTEVTPLSFDAETFKKEFNGSGGQSRLVAVLSPT